MMRARCFGVAVIALVVAVVPAAGQVPAELIAYPDLVLVNGKVVTVDEAFTVAEAVAVRDGRVLTVGTTAEIERLVGPSTRRIDLAGRSVVPGFIDSDGDNAFAGGDLYKQTQINGRISDDIVAGASMDEVLAKIRELVQTAQPGSPVYIRVRKEWIDAIAKLTLKDLDALAPNNPLFLGYSGSDAAVNAAMLARAFAAGLPREHVGVVKDANGLPSGHLFGGAQGIIGWNLRDWPVLDEEIYGAQEKINDAFLRVGVTTVTGHASGFTTTVMSQLYHQGRLKLRIRPDLDFARENPLAAQFLRRTPNLVNFGLGDGMIRIVGAAIGPVDGASDEGGILTHSPKLRVHESVGGGPTGRNRWTGSTFSGRHWGDLSLDEKRQTEAGTLLLLRKHGWNIGGNHNMGSQATHIVLETLLEAEKQPDIKVPRMLGRHALDHNLIWDDVSMGLAKQMRENVVYGLNAEIWDMRVIRGEEMLMAQYGERTIEGMQPVKDLLEAGIPVHFEGGNPDQPPLWRIERFVTRNSGTYSSRTARGRVARTWAPDQAIDRKQALRMTTLAAAYFIGEEASLGSIEKGKFADMVVLDGDYMGVADDKIDEIEPVMTIVGGRVVFDADAPSGTAAAR